MTRTSPAQTNPVIFVLMGEAAEILPRLSAALQNYAADGYSFLIIERDFIESGEQWLREQVNRIQKELSQLRYTTDGVVRVNYILRSASPNLTAARSRLERNLSYLYPVGTLTDVFWLMDDASALDARTEDAMSIMRVFLARELPDARIYLLSNLDDQNIFREEEEIIRTIALLTLFKNYRPTEYPVPADASRYNEFLFMENAHAPNKGVTFLTAASASLTLPEEPLKALIAAAILEKPERQELSAAIPPPPKARAVTMEYILGLAVPAKPEKMPTRRAAITHNFGDTLNRIAEFQSEPQLEAFPLPEEDSFYARLTLIEKQKNLTAQTLAEEEDNLSKILQEFDDWLNEPHICGQKRNLSFMVKQELWVYTLALEYINKLLVIKCREKYRDALKAYLSDLAKEHDELSFHLPAMESARQKLLKPVPHLCNWLKSSRHFNIRLKTGYAGLYTEANILIEATHAAELKKSYESAALERVNLFAAGALNRVDVLYHAGCFNLEDMYYKDLYL